MYMFAHSRSPHMYMFAHTGLHVMYMFAHTVGLHVHVCTCLHIQ